MNAKAQWACLNLQAEEAAAAAAQARCQMAWYQSAALLCCRHPHPLLPNFHCLTTSCWKFLQVAAMLQFHHRVLGDTGGESQLQVQAEWTGLHPGRPAPWLRGTLTCGRDRPGAWLPAGICVQPARARWAEACFRSSGWATDAVSSRVPAEYQVQVALTWYLCFCHGPGLTSHPPSTCKSAEAAHGACVSNFRHTVKVLGSNACGSCPMEFTPACKNT